MDLLGIRANTGSIMLSSKPGVWQCSPRVSCCEGQSSGELLGFWDEHKRPRKLKVRRGSGPILMLGMRGFLGREQSLLLRGVRREGAKDRAKAKAVHCWPLAWPLGQGLGRYNF